MDYLFLQQYWWFIISLLGAILVLMLFIQGGQSLLYTIGHTEVEKSMLINSLGRKWELTYTTLVTFGGAFFASFPLFYSTSFGGAYWVWMAILICFVLQAVAYEFRMKEGNLLGQRVYEAFLLINGFGGMLLLGTAVGTLFTGSEFSVNILNITDSSQPVISRWEHPAQGLEAVLNYRNVLLGVAVVLLSRSVAALYFMNNIANDVIFERSRKQLFINSIGFLVVFVPFLVITLLSDGFGVTEAGVIEMVPYKYGLNLIEMPAVAVMLIVGVVLYLVGVTKGYFSAHYTRGIWFSGAGVLLVVLSLFLLVGYNNTSYYPSTHDLQSSLTITNSSSSQVTLTLMAYASMLIPLVVAYIAYVWRAMDRKPITEEEMLDNSHKY
ncbi:MAG: cytochrome d ubiquinol oxidase subunit II [Rikenellaceae bacterium]